MRRAGLEAQAGPLVRAEARAEARRTGTGDLGDDCRHDLDFPRGGNIAAVRSYLSHYGNHITDAFNAARVEYRSRPTRPRSLGQQIKERVQTWLKDNALDRPEDGWIPSHGSDLLAWHNGKADTGVYFRVKDEHPTVVEIGPDRLETEVRLPRGSSLGAIVSTIVARFR